MIHTLLFAPLRLVFGPVTVYNGIFVFALHYYAALYDVRASVLLVCIGMTSSLLRVLRM